MSLNHWVRQHLPAQLQDLLRTVLDLASPRRRRLSAQRRVDLADASSAAKKVSPDGRVLVGIFAGLWLPFGAPWGGLSARLAGGYEEELVPELRRLIADAPPLIIDVGSAEGYYAVGLARALPSSTVIAFDIDRRARQLCALTARRNDVRNLRVAGRIDPRRLQRLIVPGALVVSDCEGYEDELLDPELVPGLGEATILVELHEFAVPGLTRRVLDRFAGTHDATIIDAGPRDPGGRPHLDHLGTAEARAAIDEGRPVVPHPMQWAVLRPRSAESAQSGNS